MLGQAGVQVVLNVLHMKAATTIMNDEISYLLYTTGSGNHVKQVPLQQVYLRTIFI